MQKFRILGCRATRVAVGHALGFENNKKNACPWWGEFPVEFSNVLKKMFEIQNFEFCKFSCFLQHFFGHKMFGLKNSP